MPRTTLTKTTLPGRYATTGQAVAMAAADTVNKNQFRAQGNDLVLVHNTGASPYTVTIESEPLFGREGDITAFSIPAGAIVVFHPFELQGWVQSDGYIYLEASNAAIKFGVITLPD